MILLLDIAAAVLVLAALFVWCAIRRAVRGWAQHEACLPPPRRFRLPGDWGQS